MSNEIDAYIQSAPEELQEQLQRLRNMIEQRLPGLEVAFPNGFPVYSKNSTWISGFAWRKKGPMFYLMLDGILQSRAKQFGNLITGKSCLLVKANKSLSVEDIEKKITEMLDEASSRLA